MIALLSLDWWVKTLGGNLAQAAAIVALVTSLATVIGGGITWLRADARSDAVAQCKIDIQTANGEVEKTYRKRLSDDAAAARRAIAERQRDLDAQLEENAALRKQVATLTPQQLQAVCYPKDLVRSLNR